PLDGLRRRLAWRGGSGAAQSVGGLDDHGVDGLRLDLVVVGLHRMRGRLRLALTARQVTADERVRSLDLMGDRLAYVVQQRRAARGLGARAELVGHHRGELRTLDAVGEDVLPVARAALEPAEDLGELRVEPVAVGVEARLLA